MWYYTGEPCGRGHVAMRYTSTANCCACKAARDPNAVDGRRIPRVVKLGYHPGASLADRVAAAEALDTFLAALALDKGYPVLAVMVNKRPND